MKKVRGKQPPGHIANYLGVIGETLLDRPFYWLIDKSKPNFELGLLLEDIDSLIEDNSRLLILDSALVLEEKIDRILLLLIPGHKMLSKKRDFTFSMKIDLLSAMKIIPEKLLRGVDFTRKLRNKVAHNRRTSGIDILVENSDIIMQHLGNFVSEIDTGNGAKEKYRELILVLNNGFIIFEKSVERTFSFLRNDIDISEIIRDFDK